MVYLIGSTRETFMLAAPSPHGAMNFRTPHPTQSLEMHVRCKRCDACLDARRRDWGKRARLEVKRASRTWFVSLTLAPWVHSQHGILARQGGGDATEQNKIRLDLFGREVTKYLKRLRKNSGVRFRYLLVFELHKKGELAGLPHAHLFIHEGDGRISKHRHLEKAWTLGFSKEKLVKTESVDFAARYVTKYVAKAMIARVRASIAYGRGG